MVKTYGLTHIALAVRDPERSFRFYAEVLGAVAVYRQETFIQMQTPGSRDVIVLERKAEAAGKQGGIAHFGFRLLDPAAIENAVRSVEEAGGTILKKGEFCPGEPYVFFLDPDGYEVEIWHELPTPVDPLPARHHFELLARYNTIANRNLYDACARLDDREYRKERAGSFRTIHYTLNHILLGDRLWMARFTDTGGMTTPPLGTVLYDDFPTLRAAREAQDAVIEEFMANLTPAFLAMNLDYVNNAGKPQLDPAPLVLAHLFNHQTHHRGQVHVMLSETTVKPPSLDMHRAIRP
jgi:uncharacterized damage-inducible protein DinB/catechol 2,3-dioxygenase-like lactoylglutathione lyase family enzyme